MSECSRRLYLRDTNLLFGSKNNKILIPIHLKRLKLNNSKLIVKSLKSFQDKYFYKIKLVGYNAIFL